MNFRYRDWRVIARFRGLPGLHSPRELRQALLLQMTPTELETYHRRHHWLIAAMLALAVGLALLMPLSPGLLVRLVPGLRALPAAVLVNRPDYAGDQRVQPLPGGGCETRVRNRPPTEDRRRTLTMSDRPMFALGKLVATPGALAKFEEAGQQPRDFLARHVSGRLGRTWRGRPAGQRQCHCRGHPAAQRLPALTRGRKSGS